jgi:hypothetical protein
VQKIGKGTRSDERSQVGIKCEFLELNERN